MKKYTIKLALFLIPALLVPTLAFSQGTVQQIQPEVSPPAVEANGIINETSDLWFVELSSPPAADGTKLRTLRKEKAAFRFAAKKAGLKYSERYAFDTLWNGLSVKIDPKSIGTLARISGVKALYPVVSMSIPETTTTDPDLFTALAMSGADVAQTELGYTGEGIKVAVMDTGIDYDHPDLGGCFGDGCRVAYGWDFVGDDYDAGAGTDPVPDADPDDCQGHGTHVAGIVGASGVVTGVAPNVTFGAYRVFGCDGSTDGDIMIAAMERALADGMDVLNMSIGSSFEWPQYPTATASDRLVNKGMVVVASIGNSGTSGTYAAGAPGVGKKVIGVASFDNTHAYLPYFEVNGSAIPYVEMTYAGPTPTSGDEEYVYIGRACNASEGDTLLADPTGKAALIVRGACSFNEKATFAIDSGATSVIIHNSSPGVFNGTLGTPIDDGTTPVVGISLEDGLYMIDQAAPASLTWTNQSASAPSPTGGLISSFSSYGLAPDLSLKPDIGAPGGSIYSTYVMEKSDYATLGGTSMASPHVAGAAALLLEAKPKTPSQAVRRILQNSADPAPWNLNPGIGFYDSVHRQGAGMLDIDDAILATTVIEPGKISLGESEVGPTVHTLTIENNGSNAVTYDLSEEWWTIATTGTFATYMGYWGSDGFLIMPPSVLVPADGTATVNVTFVPPTGPGLSTYGGYIALTPQDGGQVYRVPYAGFDGDYQELPVLDANPHGLPWSVGCTTCSMEGPNVAEFWVNLGHQVRKFRMEIFDANSGRAWHRAYDLDYVGRNSTENNIYSFPWDGTTVNGKKVNTVPDGDYTVVISVQKALGEDDNPDHWETWTSPVITIARP